MAVENQIEKAASFIIERAKEEGLVVHRYDARTSDSIYLKFDWGLAHSLRISDHKGIEKYHYKFNLIRGISKTITVSYRNKNHSNYYPFREIYQCLDDILANREEVIKKHNGIERYIEEMTVIQKRIERLPREKLYPFWKYGKRVD